MSKADRAKKASLVPEASGPLPRMLRWPVLKLAGVSRLNTIYGNIPRGLSPLEFARQGLEQLGVHMRLVGDPLESVPAQGPLVIVSNHPFGAIEGVLLPALLLERRPDLRILANYLLQGIPEMRELFIAVDPFEGRGKAEKNMGGMRQALQHLHNGGALAIFPSGTVSHLQYTNWEIVDPEWRPAVGRIAHSTGAQVVPVYFHGRNSYFFNLAGLIHPLARTALLPKELLRKRNSTITVSIGRPVSPATLAELPDDVSRTALLRMRTYAQRPPRKRRLRKTDTQARRFEPFAEAAPLEELQAELQALPAEQILLRDGPWLLAETDMGASPALLHEIGRLREVTFREVGEGSGLARDLDDYDESYRHLFLWHEGEQCIAGGYRLGEVDKILHNEGPRGLYATSLFRLDPRFFARTSPALELGRAFVSKKFQRDYAPLLLLWKGIGQFLLRRPGTRYLFGPVSVSLEYTPFSLKSIMAYLLCHHGAPHLEGLVQGLSVPRFRHASRRTRLDPDSMDFNTLNSVVREMEGGRTIPILFKHYLKLNGKIATFHVDRDFGTLDAFLVIDVLEVPPRMLARFMGREGAELFARQTPVIQADSCRPFDPRWGI